MLKIATHDSATGERGIWWTALFTPFSKTQSKTLVEQYNVGCRMFDIRVRKHKGSWHCAHGLWVSKYDVFSLLFILSRAIKDKVYISITYEGKNPDRDELKIFYDTLKGSFKEFTFMYLAIKYGDESNGAKVKYSYLEKGEIAPNKQGFKQLDGRSWHTYLPIPWLWKKIYNNNPVFDEESYTYVDFL